MEKTLNHPPPKAHPATSPQVPSLTLNAFSPREDSRLFSGYLKIKYEIFVVEKRNHSLPHDASIGRTLPDAFDYNSTIVTASLEGEGVIGALRICELDPTEEFPHRRLFAHHLEAAAIRRFRAFKITAVGVKKTFRRKSFLDQQSQRTVSAGEALMNAAVKVVREMGGEIAFLSTDVKGAMPFFLRLGFQILDKPQKMGRIRIVNMALLVNDHEGLKAINSTLELPQPMTPAKLPQLLARDYLQQRHKKAAKHLLAKKPAKAS